MSFQHKALRGQLVKTHTQGRVVLRATGKGVRGCSRNCLGYDREMSGLQMMSTTWRSFSAAAASFTPNFSTTFLKNLLSFPPLQLFCPPVLLFSHPVTSQLWFMPFSLYCHHSSSTLCKINPSVLC